MSPLRRRRSKAASPAPVPGVYTDRPLRVVLEVSSNRKRILVNLKCRGKPWAADHSGRIRNDGEFSYRGPGHSWHNEPGEVTLSGRFLSSTFAEGLATAGGCEVPFRVAYDAKRSKKQR